MTPGRAGKHQRQQEADTCRMQEALALARRGLGFTRPNPPVGAVIVSRGRVVGRGYHRVAGGPHAEVEALNEAGARSRGATLYVTLEPCSTRGRTPPCTAAILDAGLARVVVGARDPNPRHAGKGLRVLRRAGVTVDAGVAAAEAGALIQPFSTWITTGRPFVTLKMGTTLDGRIADAQGSSQWITGPVARDYVQDLRRQVDAVMVGSLTAVQDDPSLRCRHPEAPPALRVIVDGRGRLSPHAQVLTDGEQARTIVATTRRCPKTRLAAYRATGARVWTIPEARGHVSLTQLVRRLGREGLLHVLCEGGGALAAALVAARLVDEYLWFLAPKLLGGTGIPALGGGWLLSQAPALTLTGCQAMGDDILVRAIPDHH